MGSLPGGCGLYVGLGAEAPAVRSRSTPERQDDPVKRLDKGAVNALNGDRPSLRPMTRLRSNPRTSRLRWGFRGLLGPVAVGGGAGQ